MDAHSDEGVYDNRAPLPVPGDNSSIATTPNEGVATQTTNLQASADLRRNEGVLIPPNYADVHADTSRLEWVTNLKSSKQDSADSTAAVQGSAHRHPREARSQACLWRFI